MDDPLQRMILIFVLVNLPAWCFIGYALYSTVKERRRQDREYTRATGTVTELIPHEVRTGRNGTRIEIYWKPVVEYNADGTLVKHESPIEYREGDFEVGETVDLFYDLNDPSHFHLEKHYEREAYTAKLCIKIGLVWTVVSAVIAYFGGR